MNSMMGPDAKSFRPHEAEGDAMRARVKATYRWPILLAFNGVEFDKKEWRMVPAGFEEAAKAHAALEIEEEPKAEPKPTRKVAEKPVEPEEPKVEAKTEEAVEEPAEQEHHKRARR